MCKKIQSWRSPETSFSLFGLSDTHDRVRRFLGLREYPVAFECFSLRGERKTDVVFSKLAIFLAGFDKERLYGGYAFVLRNTLIFFFTNVCVILPSLSSFPISCLKKSGDISFSAWYFLPLTSSPRRYWQLFTNLCWIPPSAERLQNYTPYSRAGSLPIF